MYGEESTKFYFKTNPCLKPNERHAIRHKESLMNRQQSKGTALSTLSIALPPSNEVSRQGKKLLLSTAMVTQSLPLEDLNVSSS